MRETQKRINAYKKALPHMKERVMAVAMLLVISATMMISTTFAWITLATNPEVSGLATTISANGNLEIALSDIDGLDPDATTVDDGNGSITQTNLKWGNLVNLSHESYGLDYLTLRPASLNTAALSVCPMFSVKYAQDGRIEGYQTDFAFSNYNPSAKVFDVHDVTQYGVRAISSVTYSNAHAASFYTKQLETITESMADSKTKFSNIYGNSTYMSTVTALVGIHVSAYMGSDDISCLTHISNLNKIMADLTGCADAAGQTLVDIANLYLYDELSKGGQSGAYESLAYKLADLKENNYSNAFVTKYSAKIKGITLYVNMARNLQAAITGLANAQKNEDGDVLWKRDLEDVADLLCGISDATLKDQNVSYWSSHKSEAASLLLSGSVETASLNSGIIRDLDKILGEPLVKVERIKVPVTLPKDFQISLVAGRTFNLTVNVKTNAASPFELPTAYNEAYIFANNAASSDRGTPVAADTYGMAIDFWVRTNEKDSLLMLEGDIQYHVEYIPITGTDANGTSVPLYTYKNTNNEDISVYKVAGNGDSVTWYNASTHEVENVGSAVPTAQQEEIKTPIGYKGVNRVWGELDDPNSDYSQLIQNGTSTTQGSGSCYIFYPETPEDQEQSLHLLEAMSVAFIDANGTLLGQARMDTSSAIEDAGRVIVPLRMQLQNPIVVGKDSAGNDLTEAYYITPLNQNEAMRVTAIVYLDGKNLSNSDVLAAGSINGQLNVQFGLNKMEQAPLKDSDVMDDYYTIHFAQRSFHFDAYDADTCKVNLEMTLAGTQPGTVTGSFISYISATQGARQREFSMVYDEDSRTWKATVPFGGPGDFRLRSIQIDGVDVLLPEDQTVSVVIDGLGVASLVCTNWGGDGSSQSLMTADASYRQEVILTLGSSSGTIPAVQGVFIGDNGKNVTVDFSTTNGSVYTGYANFTSGGTYKLTYVIIDGVYTSLNPQLHKTLNLKLNLRTTVVLGQPVDQGYYELIEDPDTTQADIDRYLDRLHNGTGIAGDQNEKGLELVRSADGSLSFVTDCAEPLFVDVRCFITDDQGKILSGLSDVELMYSTGGITNALDSDMLENVNAGYYAGRFTLESNGVFSFREVSFTLQGRNYSITSAISAPTITAIQPAPMEYVEQPVYEEMVYDLRLTAEDRLLYIKLKNAAAAVLDITLTNADGVTAKPTKVTAGEADANNITTFAVQVPSDGHWKITDVLAKNVFYNGTFYTGTGDADTWLDISQWIRDDVIAQTFITEATIQVTGDAPSTPNYTGAFMTPHLESQANDPMTIAVLGYDGRPLEEILKDADINEEVTVDLSYAWDSTQANLNYTYSGDLDDLPQHVFRTTYDEVNHKAVMEPINFLLAGTYTLSRSVTIGDVTYDAVTASTIFDEVLPSTIPSILTVTWTAPEVEISAIAPSGSHSTIYNYWGWRTKTVTSEVSTDKHTATVYPMGTTSGSLWISTSITVEPQVTLKLTGKGAADEATMTFAASGGGTVRMYPGASKSSTRTDSFAWTSADTCTRYIGYHDWGAITTVTVAGSLTGNKVVMKYGDASFTFTLGYTITINNPSP